MVQGQHKSTPMIHLGRFVGSPDDSDAPQWTRLLQPRQTYYFTQPRACAAELVGGLTDIVVESISSVGFSPL